MTGRVLIHAGTHKTASTYIQERLHLNQLSLSEHGYTYQYPNPAKPTFKSLASDICKGKLDSLKDFIDSHHNNNKDLLLSAEQFSVPLTNTKTLKKIQAITKARGYELTIIIFIRSQLDYINSRYNYSLRRFYHTCSFDEFLNAALKGRLPGESRQRGQLIKRNNIFDFLHFFKPLLNARASDLEVKFIPFKQGNQDPFDQFLDSIGLTPGSHWLNCRNRYLNRSPGTRGVWLSRLLSQRLEKLGIQPEQIEGSSKIILNEEQWRGWHDPAHWGYSKKGAKSTYAHFAQSNDLFARTVWGKDWQKLFPEDAALIKRQRSTYRPQSLQEELMMHGIADHLLSRIQHKLNPKPWHVLTDPVERLSSRVKPRTRSSAQKL